MTPVKAKRVVIPPTFDISDGIRILFEPQGIGDFTHRVVILQKNQNDSYVAIAKDWYAHSPQIGKNLCARTALYYWDKHVGKTGEYYR